MDGQFAGVTSVDLEGQVRRLRRSTSPSEQADAIEAAAILVLRLAAGGPSSPEALSVTGVQGRLWWSAEWPEDVPVADRLDVEWLIDRVCPHREPGAVAAMDGRRKRWSAAEVDLDAEAPKDDDVSDLLLQHGLIRTDDAVLDAVLLNESAAFSNDMLAAAARGAGDRSRRSGAPDATILVGLVRASRILLRLAPEAVAFMISIILPLTAFEPARVAEIEARRWDGFALPFDPGAELDEEVEELLRTSPGLLEAVIAGQGYFRSPREVLWFLMAGEVRRRYPDPGRPPPQPT